VLHNPLVVNILRKTSLVMGILLSAFLAIGQSDASFEASTDARQVVLDGYFEVNFTLKNANGTQFAPPSFKDLTIVAGPNTSSSMQIINGQVTREMTYGYTLQPTKIGNFTIGSATVKANGKLLRSDPISVEVVKSNVKPKAGNGEQFFIRVIPNKKSAYIGEQVMLDFKLYTRVGIEGYDVPEDPDYDGFYAVELRRFSSNTVQEVLNGQQYATKVLRRIALFPQQTGKLTVDPFRIQLAVVEEAGGRSGFFFQRNVKPVYFTTDAIEIDVKPLPGNEPEGFCGAVGSYQLQAGIDRKAATTDDAITLTLVLTGNGDVKRVQPPLLSLSDSFEVYEPKMVGEKTDEVKGEIISEKRFEYLILPKYAGNYRLNPSISYFNSETGQFASFPVGPFPLSVKMGTGKPNASRSKSNELGISDILPIKTSAKLEKQGSPFTGSWLFYLLALVPIIGFAALVSYQKKLQELSNIDPNIMKIRSAGREAQKRLSTAQEQLQLGNSRAFYDEISKAYIGYVCDKTGLPLSQLTKENVREKLATLQINPTKVDEFVKIVHTCEAALYAGMDNPASMNSTYENAIGVITAIEDELDKNKA
jgi:BatD DUF11 like domain